MSERIIDLAKSLRLHGFAEASRHQFSTPAARELDFESRCHQLLMAEEMSRSDSRRRRLLREAKFRIDARPEDYETFSDRGIEKSTMTGLFAGHWIENHDNVVITGATGTGKTWIGCCLGHVAVRAQHSCKYFRTDMLLEAIDRARLDGSLQALRRGIVNVTVLVLDDFALTTLSDQAQVDLFDFLEPRAGNNSTILIAQRAFAEWPSHITNPLIADAIMDRFIPRSHKLNLTGKSRR